MMLTKTIIKHGKARVELVGGEVSIMSHKNSAFKLQWANRKLMWHRCLKLVTHGTNVGTQSNVSRHHSNHISVLNFSLDGV